MYVCVFGGSYLEIWFAFCANPNYMNSFFNKQNSTCMLLALCCVSVFAIIDKNRHQDSTLQSSFRRSTAEAAVRNQDVICPDDHQTGAAPQACHSVVGHVMKSLDMVWAQHSTDFRGNGRQHTWEESCMFYSGTGATLAGCRHQNCPIRDLDILCKNMGKAYHVEYFAKNDETHPKGDGPEIEGRHPDLCNLPLEVDMYPLPMRFCNGLKTVPCEAFQQFKNQLDLSTRCTKSCTLHGSKSGPLNEITHHSRVVNLPLMSYKDMYIFKATLLIMRECMGRNKQAADKKDCKELAAQVIISKTPSFTYEVTPQYILRHQSVGMGMAPPKGDDLDRQTETMCTFEPIRNKDCGVAKHDCQAKRRHGYTICEHESES